MNIFFYQIYVKLLSEIKNLFFFDFWISINLYVLPYFFLASIKPSNYFFQCKKRTIIHYWLDNSTLKIYPSEFLFYFFQLTTLLILPYLPISSFLAYIITPLFPLVNTFSKKMFYQFLQKNRKHLFVFTWLMEKNDV